MQENWLDIKDYEGIYQVSNLGRVRRTLVSSGTSGGLLSLSLRNGYPVVKLSYNGKRTDTYVHVLVAGAFIGKKPKGYHCHHKDGNRANARLDNLEYVSVSAHRRKHFIEECKRLVPGQRGDGAKIFDKWEHT